MSSTTAPTPAHLHRTFPHTHRVRFLAHWNCHGSCWIKRGKLTQRRWRHHHHYLQQQQQQQ
jgi:hypothetical protein